MSKKKRFILCGGSILVELVLYALGSIILPPTIGIQIQFDGTLSNQVNKYIGLLVPLGLTVAGSIYFYNEEIKKALGFSILGIIIYAVTFWANLR
jgi:hypothetical protein